ncbi:hypothetical protein V8G54_027125 [Vigna mungo]|uniref:Uncharacterized protein n=1 Tax=Vigna mungo TaxID=3915 RepID=A0AAQ3N2A6_VIGMU
MPLTDHISLISLPAVTSLVVVHSLLRLVFINTKIPIITIITATVTTNQLLNNLKIIIQCCFLRLEDPPIWFICPLLHVLFTSIVIHVPLTHHQLVHVLISKHQILKSHFFLFYLPAKAHLAAAPIRGTAACFTSKHKHGTVCGGVILHGTNTDQRLLVLIKGKRGGCVCVIT